MLVLRVVDELGGPWLLRMLRRGRRRRQRQGLLACRRLRLLLRLRLLRWWLSLLAALPLPWLLLLRELLGRVCQLLEPEPDLVRIAMTTCMRQQPEPHTDC